MENIFEKYKTYYLNFLFNVECYKAGEKPEIVIQRMMSDESSESQKKDKKDEYSTLILEADEYFSSNDFIYAKSCYGKALRIKPKEDYPKNQLKKIEKILEEEKLNEIKEQYELTIQNADKLFSKKEYERAKGLYIRASQLIANEDYPKEKISEIDAIFSNSAKQQQNDSIYLKYIDKADKLFAKREFEEALKLLKEALKLKPNELYPKQKIEEIEDLIENIEKNKYDITFADGYYMGETQNGQMHGEGTRYWNNGKTASGLWQNNLPSGKFIIAMNSKTIYEGDVSQGKLNGYGVYNFDNGEVYKGYWKDDMREGDGKLYDIEGNLHYDGEWHSDKQHGYGKRYIAKRLVYEGFLEKGKRHGQGIAYNPQGAVLYEGDWENDKPLNSSTYIE